MHVFTVLLMNVAYKIGFFAYNVKTSVFFNDFLFCCFQASINTQVYLPKDFNFEKVSLSVVHCAVDWGHLHVAIGYRTYDKKPN